MSTENLAKGYFSLLLASIFLPGFGTIDSMAVKFLAFSVINFLTIILIPFSFKKEMIRYPIKNWLFVSYSLFLFFSAISMVKSINIVASLVRLNQILTFLVCLYLIIVFVHSRSIKINFILKLVSISLVLDISASMYQYYQIVGSGFNFSFSFSDSVRGLTANKNILAASILMRLPLMVYLATRLKNKYFYIFTFLISIISFYDIYLLSARAVYLTLIISVLAILVFSVDKYLKSKEGFFKSNRHILLLFFIPIIISIFAFQYSIDSSDNVSISNRIQTVTSNSDDQSITERIRFYTSAFNYIIKNPILGSGVGNWKIVSINLDKENLKSYIIPYNAHNDFLEVFAESGIFAFIAFTMFYVMLFKLYYVSFKSKNYSNEKYNIACLLLVPGVTYFIDLNLNFPSIRPLMIYCLLMYISILILTSYKNEIES